ncbi:hypothetical protein O3M35_009544 [Rhynocoris fuscipes]|uniref:Uncharacterized protein n=1 Tax=Rhynocoris fuscipes TaxID=488301 RepID=A0AAW1D8N7_9HEMI
MAPLISSFLTLFIIIIQIITQTECFLPSIPRFRKETASNSSTLSAVSTIEKTKKNMSTEFPSFVWKIEDKIDENIDFDYYIIISGKFLEKVDDIIMNINKQLVDLQFKIKNFEKKLISDIDKFNVIITNIRSSKKICFQYKPDKIRYQASYNQLAELLLFIFKNRLIELNRKIDRFNIKINSTKELIKFNSTNTELKFNNEFELLIRNIIKELFNEKREIIKNSFLLSEHLLQLEENERELELNISRKIGQEILSFSCCTKKFYFEPVDYKCDDFKVMAKADGIVGISDSNEDVTEEDLTEEVEE